MFVSLCEAILHASIDSDVNKYLVGQLAPLVSNRLCKNKWMTNFTQKCRACSYILKSGPVYTFICYQWKMSKAVAFPKSSWINYKNVSFLRETTNIFICSSCSPDMSVQN